MTLPPTPMGFAQAFFPLRISLSLLSYHIHIRANMYPLHFDPAESSRRLERNWFGVGEEWLSRNKSWTCVFFPLFSESSLSTD